ncbi:HAD-IA family hydrolase [Lachnospiraceae bacterium 46-15]
MDYGKLTKKAVVLDFDGTICHLFGHYDLKAVNLELQRSLLMCGVNFEGYEDCFDAFKCINNQQLDANVMEKALITANRIIEKAECEAVNTSTEILGLTEFMEYCMEQGVRLGIASNNSPGCIHLYLKKKSLDKRIPVWGRDIHNLSHLKPDPWSLNKVVEEINISKEQVLFVGDNPTDYECSLAAEVDFIAIASTEKKKKRFEKLESGCLLINNYFELLDLNIVG